LFAGGELLGLVDVSGDLPECAVLLSLISTGFSIVTTLELTSVYGIYLTSLKLPPKPKL
jgi:hypothetical protein